MKKLFTLLFCLPASMACLPVMAQLPIMKDDAGVVRDKAQSAAGANNIPVPNHPSGGARPPSAQSLGILESATSERILDRVFDVNRDSFDLENGTLKWKGRTFSVGHLPVVRARFERYLSTPVNVKNFESYQGIINEITAQLAASNYKLSIEQLRAPWSKLFDAAEYDVDGGASITIANLVYLSWRMRDEFSNQREREVEQNRVVDWQRKRFVGAASFLEYARDRIIKYNNKGLWSDKYDKNTVEIPTFGPQSYKAKYLPIHEEVRTEGTAEIAMLGTQLSEEVAELVTQKAATIAMGTKAILQFQSHALAFLYERKFQQAQIASMFYRHIYSGDASALKIGAGKKKNGDEVVNTFMGVENYVPTMDMLEMVATEARKDVRDGMTAVSKLYDSGELYSALRRLMETFVLGEFEPALQVFDYEKKKALKEIYNKISTIKVLADDKDWSGIEEIVSEIKKTAKDFPEREILSKVRAAMRESNMHIVRAKQSAVMGKNDEVEASITSAMKAWPLNPELESFGKDLLGMAEGSSLYTRKFDDNVSNGNLRNIVSEAPEYGLAFKNDPKRASSLREIIVRISKVDALIAQAEEFVKQGNIYFAWDILESAVKIEPRDPVLAVSRSRLAPDVADYVKTVSRAQQAESDKKYAAALNLYIAAQKIFPASQICHQGIERLAPLYAK